MKRRARHPKLAPKPLLVGEETRALQKTIEHLRSMSVEELFALAVRAGIYTKDGKLTPPYRDDAPPSACRPTK